MAQKDALRSLDRFSRQAMRWVAEASERSIRDAAAEAKRTTVFKDRTGNHRRSITGELDRDIGTQIRSVLRAGMEYSGYLELGTSRQSPRPHLWPAMRITFQSREAFQKRLQSTHDRFFRNL